MHVMMNRLNLRGERLSMRMILPRLLLIVPLGLMGSFGSMIVAVVVATYNTSPPPSPFESYVEVLPGAAIPAIDTLGFTCRDHDYNYYNSPAETHCDLNTETGAITHIEVMYSGGLIHQTNFDLREGALNVGELASWLGVSSLYRGDSVVFTWRGNIGVARIQKAKHFSLFRNVWQVTLTDMPMFRP